MPPKRRNKNFGKKAKAPFENGGSQRPPPTMTRPHPEEAPSPLRAGVEGKVQSERSKTPQQNGYLDRSGSRSSHGSNIEENHPKSSHGSNAGQNHPDDGDWLSAHARKRGQKEDRRKTNQGFPDRSSFEATVDDAVASTDTLNVCCFAAYWYCCCYAYM